MCRNMTGAASTNSPHAYDQIQRVFMEEYLASDSRPSAYHKNAWQSVALCKATIEIMSGDKHRMEEIHKDMTLKYKIWEKLICDGSGGFFKLKTCQLI